jgi:small redox-active disulfide protein 2
VNVKILGVGCANCKRLKALVREVAAAEQLQLEIDEVTDIPVIMGYGIMQTPGLVIAGKVVASGRIPRRSEISDWLQAAVSA